jgi:O-acetyl-ADP-ribose deacetylase
MRRTPRCSAAGGWTGRSTAAADRSALLASCYTESLRVADELGARAVAFPAVSAGIYGWPADDAARIALATVRAADSAVQEARFVLFTDQMRAVFAAALDALNQD